MSISISVERSRSRGRGYVCPFLLLLCFSSSHILAINQESTGRGGAGNIRLPSNERVEGRGPEDYSDTRGRDPIPARDPDEVMFVSPHYPSAI
jgi:hypothetical protein